ncbi:glutathione S-transferase Gst3 [Schizosaccharomyces octosporus yFS286]|uniref:Glutathione S-transferase Gst3 n=1 Tax=Schizosaccharomyces octosporus (strain yFS286) TaxID=483514 RepID=S9QYQ9_SCHOY|nr:glutathione S-transferase Gst3 [Schizosaccharomyces octosporus yFS286]EPX71420.1 glutathione S-transferase Gst3 [Schizosaccharomyces octosporus yFS286]
MITLYHLSDSRSSRIIWLLEELKVPYDLKQYNRVGGRSPAEFYNLSPLGKSPVLVDDGRSYIESGAVIEHLVRKYGRNFKPSEQDIPHLEKYDFWMHYAEGSLMMLVVGLFVNSKAVEMSPFLSRFLVRKVTDTINDHYYMKEIFLNLDHVDDYLATSRYFAGDRFTAADVQMSYPLLCLQSSVLNTRPYPNIRRWLKDIGSRPAFVVASGKSNDRNFQVHKETKHYKEEEEPDMSSFSISA